MGHVSLFWQGRYVRVGDYDAIVVFALLSHYGRGLYADDRWWLAITASWDEAVRSSAGGVFLPDIKPFATDAARTEELIDLVEHVALQLLDQDTVPEERIPHLTWIVRKAPIPVDRPLAMLESLLGLVDP